MDTDRAPASRTRSLLRLLAVVIACASVALLLSIDAVYQGLQQLLATAEPLISAHPVLGAAVFVLLSLLSAILAFFSSALLVPAAVFAWGVPLTVFLLWLGWLLGGMAMYALGRSLRRAPHQQSRQRSRLSQYLPETPQQVGFPLVLLWQLALPSEVPGALCGYLGVSFRTYVIALALGELPYAIGAVLLGDSVVNRQLGSLVALGVLFATLGYFLLRRLHRRSDQRGDQGMDQRIDRDPR